MFSIVSYVSIHVFDWWSLIHYIFLFPAHKHNTYHGPSSKHFRAPLPQTSDAKPLRFTDSPQHRLSRSRRKSRPPPRRKSSSVVGCTDEKSHVSVYCRYPLIRSWLYIAAWAYFIWKLSYSFFLLSYLIVYNLIFIFSLAFFLWHHV